MEQTTSAMTVEEIAAKLAKLSKYEQYFRSSSKRYRDANKQTINEKRRNVYHTVTKLDEAKRERLNEKSRQYYARKKARQAALAAAVPASAVAK